MGDDFLCLITFVSMKPKSESSVNKMREDTYCVVSLNVKISPDKYRFNFYE